MAPGARASQPEPFCTAEWLNEEPDVGNLLVRFCEGLRHNWCMAEIMWHRRETRRQTENTNVMPVALEGLILLDKNSSSLAVSKTRTFFLADECIEGTGIYTGCGRAYQPQLSFPPHTHIRFDQPPRPRVRGWPNSILTPFICFKWPLTGLFTNPCQNGRANCLYLCGCWLAGVGVYKTGWL